MYYKRKITSQMNDDDLSNCMTYYHGNTYMEYLTSHLNLNEETNDPVNELKYICSIVDQHMACQGNPWFCAH